MTKRKRVHIVVTGRVQGVFYRKGAQKTAKELELTGFAHNLVDGTVELVAEGEKEKLDQFVQWCKQGTPLAKVNHCDVQFEEYKAEFPNGFTVREFGF